MHAYSRLNCSWREALAELGLDLGGAAQLGIFVFIRYGVTSLFSIIFASHPRQPQNARPTQQSEYLCEINGLTKILQCPRPIQSYGGRS